MAVILKILILIDLPIEYKQSLLTKLPIDCLTNNKVEELKNSSIKWLLYNIIYESNPQNADFGYLPFYGGERLIARWRLYHMNCDFLFRLINGLSLYV